MQASKDTPTLIKSPPTPPPEKQQTHEYAASDTYTEDEYVVIEWEEEDEAERAIDLANSADLSSSCTDLGSSSHSHLSSSPSEEAMHQSWHGMPYDSNPDQHKAHWYHDWLRDKTVERSDPWGFSSTGVSRAASPARGATA